MPDSCFANWPASRERLAAWYATPLGREVDASIRLCLDDLLTGIHGQHGLQLGATVHGSDLLTPANLGHRTWLLGERGDTLRAEPEALPVATDTIHLLALCHVMEFRERPAALLDEAERVLAPEGRLLIVTFNAWSLFGLRRCLPHDGVPWSGRFSGLLHLYFWSRRAGLTIEGRRGCWRRPPAHGRRMRGWLGWMERGPRFLDRWGGVQILLMRKRRAPPTPIPLGRWWRRYQPSAQPGRSGIAACLRRRIRMTDGRDNG